MFFGGDFGGFPGMGGMPGGGGGRRPHRPNEKPEIKDEFYKTLGVEKTSGAKVVKKAYRKLAMKNHPDKGGNPEVFKKIAEAYEVLGDEKKRKLYDKYGKKGLEAGGAPGGRDPSDLMSMFFGGQGGRRRSSEPSGPKKGDPVVHPLRVSLADLYKGKTQRLRITRTIICKVGENKPVELDEVEDTFEICQDCRGRGAVMKTRSLGPGFVQQMQVQCSDCGGSGASLTRGYKVQQKKETLVVEILKGMKNNQKITLRGKGDMIPGTLPGDVVFVIKQQNHSTFKRRGSDLLLEKEITLLEALCGIKWRMKHLDGREVVVSTSAGEILKSQDLKCVQDLGMPIQDTCDFGRLFVLFKVKFPGKGDLDLDQINAIEAVLGPRETKVPTVRDDEDENYLEEVDPATFGKLNQQAKGAADESDEEGGGGGQRVQCAQQ